MKPDEYTPSGSKNVQRAIYFMRFNGRFGKFYTVININSKFLAELIPVNAKKEKCLRNINTVLPYSNICNKYDTGISISRCENREVLNPHHGSCSLLCRVPLGATDTEVYKCYSTCNEFGESSFERPVVDGELFWQCLKASNIFTIQFGEANRAEIAHFRFKSFIYCHL